MEIKYPSFKEIRKPLISTYKDAKNLLKDNEAYMAFLISEQSYYFLIRKDQIKPVVKEIPNTVDSYAQMLNQVMFDTYKIDSKDYVNAINSLMLKGLSMNIDNKINQNKENSRGFSIVKDHDSLKENEIINMLRNLYGYFAESVFNNDFNEIARGIEKIFYSPDMNLWAMPIESLIMKNNDNSGYNYLGDRFDFTYIQSLSVINYFKQKQSVKKDNIIDLICFGGAVYYYDYKIDKLNKKRWVEKNEKKCQMISLNR